MVKLPCCRAFYGLGIKQMQRLKQVIGLVFSLVVVMPSLSSADAPKLSGLHPQKFDLPAQTRKIVMFDDGSTGSRVMAFCFGRNHDGEEFRLLGQSRMYDKASPLKPGEGLTGETLDVIGEFLDNSFCRTPGSPEPAFFLGATAGRRTNEGETQKLFQLIRQKLSEHPVTGEYKDITLKLLNGWEEGAYNWLGVNYTHDQLDSPQGSFGIVEMGGGSTQVAFRLPHYTLKNISPHINDSMAFSVAQKEADYVIFDRHGKKEPIEVFSESKMGFGLKYGYNKYFALKEKTGLSCDPDLPSAGVDYQKCSQVMERVFDHSVDSTDSFQERSGQLSRHLPKTFYLSGYFYDYTVAKGLPSHMRVDELEAAAEYACTHFTPEFLDQAEKQGNSDIFTNFAASLSDDRTERVVTAPESFQFSGAVPPVKNERFCANLTFMATMLRQLGITDDQQLMIVKSLTFEGKPYPATWTPGYAIAWANGWLNKQAFSRD